MTMGGDVPSGTVQHFLYFPTEDVARQVAAVVLEQGHTIKVRPAATGTDWLVLVTDAELRSPEMLDRRAKEFGDLAASHGGEYDGYESAV